MSTRRQKWILAAVILVVWALSRRVHIYDPVVKLEIYATSLLILAFFVAGEGLTLLCWSLAALFAGAVLCTPFMLISPLGLWVMWLLSFSGIVAICTGAGVRYLFDIVVPLQRFRILRCPIQFGDRMTRLYLKHNESWMFGFGFWIESLVLNTLSAVTLSCIALILIACLFGFLSPLVGPSMSKATSMQLNHVLERFGPSWVLPVALWLAICFFFFTLFMWRSACQTDTDEVPKPSA